jgi:hypothetical protein
MSISIVPSSLSLGLERAVEHGYTCQVRGGAAHSPSGGSETLATLELGGSSSGIKWMSEHLPMGSPCLLILCSLPMHWS